MSLHVLLAETITYIHCSPKEKKEIRKMEFQKTRFATHSPDGISFEKMELCGDANQVIL